MKKLLPLYQKFLFAFLLIATNIFSQNVITVTDCNLQGWVKQVPANTSLALKNEPTNPVLGKGSLEMITVQALKNVRLRNTNYNNTLLSSLTELGFSSFIAHRENDYDAPFIVLQIDLNSDGTTDNFLEFGPQYQSVPWSTGIASDQGAVVTGSWQTWDILHGVFWLGPDIDPEHGGAVFNLATYISQHPTAKIINDAAIGGGVRLSAGGFAPNFKCYTDNFRIGVNGTTTTYDFEFTIANAGNNKKVIYGYGSNCVTLNGAASGGVAPYTYVWSGGETPNNISTVVCPAVTTTYTLTVTDKNGCTRTDGVTVIVNDVRCGNIMDKVKLCHNGEEICVAKEAVPAHLQHGDKPGSCDEVLPGSRINTPTQNEITEQTQLKIYNYPNPFTNTTRLVYELPSDGRVSIKLYDVVGKEIAVLVNENEIEGQHSIDFSREKLSGGIYYYKLSLLTHNKILSKTQKFLVVTQ